MELKQFLLDLDFEEEQIEECIDLEQEEFFDLEYNSSIYQENLVFMKTEFDDYFILQMFSIFSSVFMCSDFKEMLDNIKNQFNTDMWGTLIQYEWNETGESSVFELMDTLEIGYFEANLPIVCNKVRSLWVSDYSDEEL